MGAESGAQGCGEAWGRDCGGDSVVAVVVSASASASAVPVAAAAVATVAVLLRVPAGQQAY